MNLVEQVTLAGKANAKGDWEMVMIYCYLIRQLQSESIFHGMSEEDNTIQRLPHFTIRFQILHSSYALGFLTTVPSLTTYSANFLGGTPWAYRQSMSW
jgi:hypothetical protein